jgi:hypothetical protein
VCCAAGFAKVTEGNRHRRKSTSGRASCGFPQIYHIKPNRYNPLPWLFCLFTSTAIETHQSFPVCPPAGRLAHHPRAAPTGPRLTVVACNCYYSVVFYCRLAVWSDPLRSCAMEYSSSHLCVSLWAKYA